MSYQQAPENKPDSKPKSSASDRALISLFIAFYLVIALVQSVPTAKLPKSIQDVSDPIIALTGTKQRWNLFAPELMQVNQYSTVLIINDDGTMRLYEWPRLDLKNAVEKFELQQTRRFVTECFARPQYSYYWPGMSENIINRFSCAKAPCNQVNFRFNYALVPEFKNYTSRENLPKAYVLDTTFAYFRGSKKE